MLESGVDIIEIERIEGAISRHGSRFLERIYTPDEIQQCAGRAASLAARFAAKEAAFKTLGARLGWREVEVHRERGGKPRLVLHARAAQVADSLGLKVWSVSLSHSRGNAVAVVVARE